MLQDKMKSRWKLQHSELCVLISTLSQATFERETPWKNDSGFLKTLLITILDGWTYVNFKYSSYKRKREKCGSCESTKLEESRKESK